MNYFNVKKLVKRIISTTLRKVIYQNENIQASLAMQALNTGFFPVTNYSIGMYDLLQVCNYLIYRHPKKIVELGSGLSTLYLSRLIKQNQLDCKLISVDHDHDFVSAVQSQLEKEGLLDNCIIIHAELTTYVDDSGEYLWYNTEKLQFINEIDMLIVDGPPAHQTNTEHNRYPALPFFHNKTNPDAAIFFDDYISRQSNKRQFDKWVDIGLIKSDSFKTYQRMVSASILR